LNLDRLLGAFESARPGGESVCEWSVYVGESRGLSLGIKDREVGNAHVPLKLSETCGARYRLVWSDGKVSRGYAERRLLEADPDRALEHARAAAYDDPDAACVAGPADIPGVQLHDPSAETVARGDAGMLISRLDAVRRRVLDHGLRTWSGSFSAGHGRSRIVTSAGLDVNSEGTTTGWHVTFNGEFGDGFSARAPEPDDAFGERLDRIVATTELLARPTEPSPAGMRPVLLHPHVVEGYVLGTLLDNLSGSTVSHGDGYFRGDQFGSGRPVLREDLGFRIDPLQPLKSGSYRYTTEGVPAARCAFIVSGRLERPVLDLKYARRMGLAPTPLPSSADTMYLEGPPRLPLDDALARADGGAMVLSVLGVHTQDSASGDFSLSAPQALVIRSGRLAGRMRGTISGNLFDLLTSDEAQFVEVEGEHTPGLLFPCRLDPQ
jgi:PmbA protein